MRRLITFVASVGILQKPGQVEHQRRARRQRPGSRYGYAGFEDFTDRGTASVGTLAPGEPDLQRLRAKKGEITMHSPSWSLTRLSRSTRLAGLLALLAAAVPLAA